MSNVKKFIAVALTATTLVGTAMTSATPAAARGWGAPLAVGVLGGLAAGAIIGGATRPAYGYGYSNSGYGGGYYGDAGYAPSYGYEPVPVYDPCYRSKQPVYDAYGQFAGYRTVRTCN